MKLRADGGPGRGPDQVRDVRGQSPEQGPEHGLGQGTGTGSGVVVSGQERLARAALTRVIEPGTSAAAAGCASAAPSS